MSVLAGSAVHPEAPFWSDLKPTREDGPLSVVSPFNLGFCAVASPNPLCFFLRIAQLLTANPHHPIESKFPLFSKAQIPLLPSQMAETLLLLALLLLVPSALLTAESDSASSHEQSPEIQKSE